MKQTDKIQQFINAHPLSESLESRIPDPRFQYHGDTVWQAATSAILSGKNILLVGDKSTGKNVLAENLAARFKRPLWNVSLHMSVDASSLIGDDSLKNGAVYFREGPITMASKVGGFAVLDEINMAKNEAMAVLHSALDYRRIIDIPGYDLIKIHPATRFIATMNYGYEGTRDLNEALLSRFVVIKMPTISEDDLKHLIAETYPALKKTFIHDLSQFVADLKRKAKANEITSHATDIRGIFDALDLVEEGLELKEALNLTIINKIFDPYEEELVADLLKARFQDHLYRSDLME